MKGAKDTPRHGTAGGRWPRPSGSGLMADWFSCLLSDSDLWLRNGEHYICHAIFSSDSLKMVRLDFHCISLGGTSIGVWFNLIAISISMTLSVTWLVPHAVLQLWYAKSTHRGMLCRLLVFLFHARFQRDMSTWSTPDSAPGVLVSHW
jgi:hypothetical protein